MPKLKSHRGAAKRFRKTGTGAVKCRRAYRNHILTKKSTGRKRHLRVGARLTPENTKVALRMLEGC